ncbi:BspA family leucine-rich repeat surface protein [Bifidobacterium sp. ESL0745]|uniref:BspA family leucine-rich repeat surface protein n=1 Tax=Bifidobacterium sp. ESL0745 TaxID=2983226 RepID=UPI0023F8049A|nr:BspA family leucine-rich repeat surface protein [Bifidobacterium sp. ESL0745]MDF7666063.1 BspA family leucine-rich repeat surface protein [Bifidobacterium sp. ESL0745]
MRKNLKIVCGTTIVAAMLLAPVLAQAANPQTQGSPTTGQSQQTVAPMSAVTTPRQRAAAKPGAQDEEPSTQPPAQNCNDRGEMSHGYWALAPSAEYGGECTLTFMATDPNQENDFKGLETYADIDNEWHSYYSRQATLDSGVYAPAQIDKGARAAKFSQAKHIVFDGTTPDAKTMLPEDARWMFAEWGDYYETNWDTWETDTLNVNLKTFKSNGHLDTSHTTNMKAMFQYDWNMTDLDTTGWDTSHVKDIGSIFDEDRAFTNLDLSNWDVSSVENMYQTFWNMTGLKTLNLSGWDTANATNTDGMLSWNGLETLTVGPKTKLSAFKDFEMDHHIDPNAPGDSGWWTETRAYKGKWLKITGLSNGTSGTTQAINDPKPQTTEEVNATLTNDANRAGTYTRVNSQNQTPYLSRTANLNLKANLPAGYTAQAAADGYTADADGNLTADAQVNGVNALNVTFPTFDAAQQITGNGQKYDITQTSTAMNLPASNPFTLTKGAGTTDTYTFQGWSTTPNATAADYLAGDPVNLTSADTTLYAVWKKDVKESEEPAHSTAPAPGTSVPADPGTTTAPAAPSPGSPAPAPGTSVPATPGTTTPTTPDTPAPAPGTSVPADPGTSAPADPGTSTPAAPTQTTPSTSKPSHSDSSSSASTAKPSVSKPGHTNETGTPATGAVNESHTNGSAGNVTVQPATPAPSVTAPVAKTTAPVLAPAMPSLPMAQTLAVSATATASETTAVAVVPRMGNTMTPTNSKVPVPADQSEDGTPNNIAPQAKQRSCTVAYYSGGSVAPAAIICNAEGAALSPISTQTTSSMVPAWLFMLVFAALSILGMFAYQRRNVFPAALHRSATTR